MWKWYVYELVDPRNLEVFYVGKGSGNRINAHENEALKAEEVCSKKIRKIKDIWFSGNQVIKRKIAYFKRESCAYSFEADHIAFYGLDNLTNLAPGGGGSISVKRKQRQKTSVWNAVLAAKKFAESEVLSDYLAIWIKSKVRQCDVQFDCSFLAAGIAVKHAFESLIPSQWDLICSSREAIELCAPALAKRGVEVTHGCA